ncbi:hypothetical protein P691DRAFT_97771 [Macrolepiota fuliginosa MF-IS2]|uniref:Uncharacterized protein n=1 Tax=Macrolepiota fuliginosa MF-IS2 TaxID=1400762 RepID=A0A9P5XP56_9AGAR|nr:hypothetical protein P691DRAFT_97771 [Macrolepiota fuliginosa MF-IS2]
MGLENGLYTFRYFGGGEAKSTPIGGMYASSRNGKNKPVTAEPLGTHSGLSIRWRVAKVADKEDYFTITEDRDDECIPGQWARSSNQSKVPVFLYDHVKPHDSVFEWRIQEVDKDDDIYNIMGNSLVGGADFVDLRNEGGPQLYMKPVPFVQKPPPIPRWQLLRITWE